VTSRGRSYEGEGDDGLEAGEAMMAGVVVSVSECVFSARGFVVVE